MPNSALYIFTVLIWGTTWIGIKQQLGVVAVETSVFYRYAIATLIMFLICLVRGTQIQHPKSVHFYMLLQGLFLFCLNYIFFYHASYALTTGLVAVIFSSVVLMNVVNGRLLVGQPMRPMVIVGGVLGLIGLSGIFIPEIVSIEPGSRVWFSIFLCVIATFCASLGNVLTHKNQENNVPVLAATAWGMLYGMLFTLAYLLITGIPFVFDPSLGYVFSLLYLAVFGSVIAFICYLTLIEKIGADKASYTGVMFPVVALIISTFVEGYQWTLLAIVGLALIIIGNIIVLKAK